MLSQVAQRRHVKQTVDPVEQKVEQVDQSSQKRDADEAANLAKTNQVVDENEKKLDATDEIAKTADNEAKDAISKSNQNAKDVGDVRNNLQTVVADIEDYKQLNQTVVHFAVAKDTLTKDEKAKLDAAASQIGGLQRYFITVEGFTDQTGDAAYNDQLSRQRANQVVEYLVGSHNVPVYRIHVVGLGKQKLIDNGKGSKARQASRRVEVTIFSAKPLTASGTGGM